MVEKDIKRQMLIKFLPLIEKNFDTTATEDDDSITYSASGYVFSQRQLYEVMLEILHMDDVDKSNLAKSIYKYIGMHSNE
jgi:hypothetical protein